MKEGEDDTHTPPPTHTPTQSFFGVFCGFLLVSWGWCCLFVGVRFFLKTMLNFPVSYFHLPAQENTAVYPAVLLTFNTFWENIASISITFHGMPTIRKVLKTGMLFKARGEEGIPSSRLSCTWEIQDQMKKYILHFKNACVLVSPSIQQLDQNVITTSN